MCWRYKSASPTLGYKNDKLNILGSRLKCSFSILWGTGLTRSQHKKSQKGTMYLFSGVRFQLQTINSTNWVGSDEKRARCLQQKNSMLHYKYNFASFSTFDVQLCQPKVWVQIYEVEHFWQWSEMLYFDILFVLGTCLPSEWTVDHWNHWCQVCNRPLTHHCKLWPINVNIMMIL